MDIELTIYHNQFTNFIYMEPANEPELTIRGAFPVFNYKQTNARISGFDVKITNRFFNIGYEAFKGQLNLVFGVDKVIA